MEKRGEMDKGCQERLGKHNMGSLSLFIHWLPILITKFKRWWSGPRKWRLWQMRVYLHNWKNSPHCWNNQGYWIPSLHLMAFAQHWQIRCPHSLLCKGSPLREARTIGLVYLILHFYSIFSFSNFFSYFSYFS